MMPRGREKKLFRDKPREGSCRSDQQSEARLGEQRNRATAETGNRKTEIELNTLYDKTRIRDREELDEQEQLQHLENDNWKTVWHHKN